MTSENMKASIAKYKKAKREQVRLDVAKGTLDKYKAFAKTQGMSMTALITSIMEREMREAGFVYQPELDAKKQAEAEKAAREAEMKENLSRLKAENAAAMLDSMKNG